MRRDRGRPGSRPRPAREAEGDGAELKRHDAPVGDICADTFFAGAAPVARRPEQVRGMVPYSSLVRSRPDHRPGMGRLVPYLLILTLVGLRVASGPTTLMAYVALGAYALTGRGAAVRAVALSWFLTMINPGLAAASGAASAGRYVVLLGLVISAIVYGLIRPNNKKGEVFIYYTAIIGVLIVIHSFLFSEIVDVSILKAVSWTLTITALLACWVGMTSDERDNVISELVWGLTLLMFLSLPLAVLPVGYMVNGVGFQGLLNHPQAFGPTMALLGAWATTRMLSERQPSWFVVGVCGVSLLFVLMSGARTAGLSLVLGVLVAIFVVPWLARQPIRQLFPGLASARVWGIFSVAVLAGLIASPILISALGDFLVKQGTGGDLSEVYAQSRGRIVGRMMVNIEERPLVGIGFGVASDYFSMDVDRDGAFGIPTGAPVEKGVAFLAMLEELGIILFIVILIWFALLGRFCARGGFTSFSVFIVIILFNFGESTFFSAGGMGGLFLVFITWAYSHGAAQGNAPEPVAPRHRFGGGHAGLPKRRFRGQAAEWR